MADQFWVPGNSAGPHIERPGKYLLHTTEGSSIEGAVAAYRANNSWPHSTVDFRFGKPYRICRHLGYDVAARALRNEAGGVQTNTAGVIQLEVVGFATKPNEIDWAAIGREVVGPTCNSLAIPIPITSTVTWVAYPASYGKNAAQRLSGSGWLGYRGVLGHQHVPENSHGDPGAIPIQTLLAAASPPPLPPKGTSSDMHSYALNPDGNRLDHALIGADGSIWHTYVHSPADLKTATYEWLGGKGKSIDTVWFDGEYVVTVQGSGGPDDNKLFIKRYTATGWVPDGPDNWDMHPTAILRDPEKNV